MIPVDINQFAAKCQEFLDRAELGERFQITKDGKIIAELGPSRPEKPAYAGPGVARGEMKIVGDIMAPLDVEWEALREE